MSEIKAKADLLAPAPPSAIAIVDKCGIIRSVNNSLTALTGYDTGELVGRPVAILSVESATHRFADIIQESLRSGKSWRGEWACLGKAGHAIAAEQIVNPIKSPSGEVLDVILEIQDLRPNGAKDFDLLFNLIPDLACIVSKDGYFKRVNKAWETSLGYTLEEVLKTPMLDFIHPDDLENTLKEVARQGPFYRTKHFVNRYRHKNGTYRLFNWTTTFTRDDATRFGVAHDITDQHSAELKAQALAQQVAHSAEHDFLTGLPNRVRLNERIRQAIDLARRHNRKTAVMFMDLDGFKHINDSLGHPTGDKLLQSIALRLLSCVREVDTVSRQGGDEFVVLLSEVGNREDVAITARRLLRTVAEPHFINDHELCVTTSIGVSVYPDDGNDADTLIKNADTAMYQAKENGRENWQFFTSEMNIRAVARQSIEESLRRVLERDELSVHYQPRVNLRTGAITGAEALLRWTHPVRGPVPPAQFIPVAEDCGVIVPIGRWVLRQACEQAQSWVKAGFPPITVAVNISAMEFRNQNFLDGVFGILSETGLDPGSLELELTESVLIKNSGATESILRALRAKGVRIAVDDFGTGYSSLSYLRRFPIDALKIDQSFVSQIASSQEEATIVTALIGMGRNLKLRVIAEGVETRDELAFLQSHRCDEGQGYYFSPPHSADDFARVLKFGMPQVALPPLDNIRMMPGRAIWRDRGTTVQPKASGETAGPANGTSQTGLYERKSCGIDFR